MRRSACALALSICLVPTHSKAVQERVAPPLSLTSSDGSGLQIVSMKVRAVVEDPLAFTELHLVFKNPQPRVIEGQFEITLPPGAAVSRFAMKQPQGWNEGEVVELQEARAAYEEFLHRRQDPALLEKQAGNTFRARVFPIAASGEQELILSYSQELARADDKYTVSLRGLPELQNLDIKAFLGKRRVQTASSTLGGVAMAHESIEVRKTHFVPDVDFEVAPPPADGGKRLGLRHQNLTVARITPVTQLSPDPIESLMILIDTSASRALGFRAQLERVRDLIAKLAIEVGQDLPLKVACFDQEVVQIYSGPARGFGQQQLAEIFERRALGASDISKALLWAGATARKDQSWRRMLMVTDGVATAGATDGGVLRDAIATLKTHGVRRLDAMVTGGLRDEPALKRLVTGGGLPHAGVLLDDAQPIALSARRLQAATFSNIKVSVPGSAWVWPTQLDGVQPGDQFLIYADLPSDQKLDIVIEGAGAGRHPVELAPVQRPLLERAWVNARIQRLSFQRETMAKDDADLRAALKRQIIDISVRHRVLSDFTAMLVLETEADYARFGIERRALSDILVVGTGGAELMHRTAANVPRGSTRGEVTPETTADEESGGKDGRWRERDEEKKPEAKRRETTRDPKEPKAEPTPAPPPVLSPTPKPVIVAKPPSLPPGEHRLEVNRPGYTAPRPDKPAKGGDKRGGDRLDDLLERAPATERPAPAPPPPRAPPAPDPAPSTGRRADNDRLKSNPAEGQRVADRDADGIPDAVDRCPNEPETFNGMADDDGCPDRGRVIVTESSILILEKVYFNQDSAILKPESIRVLNAVVQVMRGNPQLGLVEVQGHTEERERPELAQARADVVRGYLVNHGVDSRRLLARSHGRSRPICGTHEPACWAKNRRIEFQILRHDANSPVAASTPAPATKTSPYEGKLAEVMSLLSSKKSDEALRKSLDWRDRDPGDVMALVALGESWEAKGQKSKAARAYGSIIDLFPSRADLRRFAGERLERLGGDALRLAVNTYTHARLQRPDHPASHRLLAFSLLRAGDPSGAFDAIVKGIKREYPSGRFRGVDRILREDAGLIAAAWLKREPARRQEILRKLVELGLDLDDAPSLRFVINWETDTNDVDLHIYDGDGGHAYYQAPSLRSGGGLYADVTTGYGPECFTVPGAARAYPYRIEAHYYSRGPMGYGMGKLEIIEHDGKGELRFEERPFVIQADRATVDLGKVVGK
jgi:outer membrane protein OmpA-like peptidoglycan-associated protein